MTSSSTVSGKIQFSRNLNLLHILNITNLKNTNSFLIIAKENKTKEEINTISSNMQKELSTFLSPPLHLFFFLSPSFGRVNLQQAQPPPCCSIWDELEVGFKFTSTMSSLFVDERVSIPGNAAAIFRKRGCITISNFINMCSQIDDR